MRFLEKAHTCEAGSGQAGSGRQQKFSLSAKIATLLPGRFAHRAGMLCRYTLFVQHTDQAVLIDPFFKLTWQ
jgi:hypothetical protein